MPALKTTTAVPSQRSPDALEMCPATIVSANLTPAVAPWHGMPLACRKSSRTALNPVVAPPVVPLAEMPFVNLEKPVKIVPQTAVHAEGVKWDPVVKSR